MSMVLSDGSDTARLLLALQEHPDWASVLPRMLAVQREKDERLELDRQAHGPDSSSPWPWLFDTNNEPGWEWHDIPTPSNPKVLLFPMVEAGILRIINESRTHRSYRVADSKAVARALELLGEVPTTPEESDVPDDLFSPIVGHEDIKRLVSLAIVAPEPVHVLLVGPPASSKSLFLSEVLRLRGSYPVLGGTLSKFGLLEVLLAERPQRLLIDEIEKARGPDLAILLRLMEHQEVIYTKGNYNVRERIPCAVFAAANSVKGLPGELLSRFAVRDVGHYTTEELRQVMFHVAHRREGMSVEQAEAIASALSQQGTDPREAVRAARLLKAGATNVAEALRLLGF